MFDTHIQEGNKNTHVTQLPHDTADAARLYGELKDRAEREVAKATIERFGVNNHLVVLRVTCERSFESNQTHTRVLFKVNEELCDIRVTQDVDIHGVVKKAIANEVALKVYEALRG